MHYLTSILAELQPTHSASSYFAIVEYVDGGRDNHWSRYLKIAVQDDGIVLGLKGERGWGETGEGNGLLFRGMREKEKERSNH
ncbi:hypothetical protein M0802_011507 [Mischocyttarus mexicanus]|nr:hypothetical protein M0802_011507 [Mischocyttarus mexicanus]